MGSKHARLSNDDIYKLEVPLLINPCTDDPELHLNFTCNGKITGVTDEGNKSIEVYGLDREHLEDRRRFTANSIICSRLKDILEDIDEFQSQPAKLMRRIDKKIEELNSFLSPKAEYSAMANCIVREYRRSYNTNRFFLEVTKELVEDSIKKLNRFLNLVKC